MRNPIRVQFRKKKGRKGHIFRAVSLNNSRRYSRFSHLAMRYVCENDLTGGGRGGVYVSAQHRRKSF